MKLLPLALGASLALLVPFGSLTAQDTIKESVYYPLKLGTTWEYNNRGQKVRVVVTKHEKVGDTLCALVEATQEGKVVATEHIAVRDDGLYRYSFRGGLTKPPVCFLKLPPMKGTVWQVTSIIARLGIKATYKMGEEEITVPAGKFKTATCEAFFTTDGKPQSITLWFAPNVGIVKQLIKVGDQMIAVDLEKFEMGK